MLYRTDLSVCLGILQLASRSTSLRPIVVRVGQLSGGLNGNWNAQEWLPSIVRSAQSVKCLPAGAGQVSWLPLHTAATAIVQMRDSSSQVLHLAHPVSASFCRWSKEPSTDTANSALSPGRRFSHPSARPSTFRLSRTPTGWPP